METPNLNTATTRSSSKFDSSSGGNGELSGLRTTSYEGYKGSMKEGQGEREGERGGEGDKERKRLRKYYNSTKSEFDKYEISLDIEKKLGATWMMVSAEMKLHETWRCEVEKLFNNLQDEFDRKFRAALKPLVDDAKQIRTSLTKLEKKGKRLRKKVDNMERRVEDMEEKVDSIFDEWKVVDYTMTIKVDKIEGMLEDIQANTHYVGLTNQTTVTVEEMEAKADKTQVYRIESDINIFEMKLDQMEAQLEAQLGEMKAPSRKRKRGVEEVLKELAKDDSTMANEG